MNLLTIAVVILVLVIMQGIGLYFIFRRRETPIEEGKDSAMILLQQQMQAIAGELRGMTREVTSVKEIGRQTQGFAQQLQNLQDILKNPKQRGILGEYYLETVLRNVMSPEDYKIQYPFKNGEIVDAVIKRYRGVKGLDGREISRLVTELKGYWGNISRARGSAAPKRRPARKRRRTS